MLLEDPYIWGGGGRGAGMGPSPSPKVLGLDWWSWQKDQNLSSSDILGGRREVGVHG